MTSSSDSSGASGADHLASVSVTLDDIAQAIDHLLARRAASASICPSDVARLLDPRDWRRLMQPVRDLAAQRVRAGTLQVTQGGLVLSADAPWRGAIRLRRAPDPD